jgi:hypothetical protein
MMLPYTVISLVAPRMSCHNRALSLLLMPACAIPACVHRYILYSSIDPYIPPRQARSPRRTRRPPLLLPPLLPPFLLLCDTREECDAGKGGWEEKSKVDERIKIEEGGYEER